MSTISSIRIEDDRTGMDDATLARAFDDHLAYSLLKNRQNSTALDRFFALALTVRDRLSYRWAKTKEVYNSADVKRVYYLSAEFLLGRSLGNNLMALGIYDSAKKLFARPGSSSAISSRWSPMRVSAMAASGASPRASSTRWRRSASPATATASATSSASSSKRIRDGWQVERPDEWLQFGNPWEMRAPRARHRP